MEAIKNGAVVAISNKRIKRPNAIFNKKPLNLFNNINLRLRKSLNTNIIAITGSAGKTSVKELTGFCLNKLDKTFFLNILLIINMECH